MENVNNSLNYTKPDFFKYLFILCFIFLLTSIFCLFLLYKNINSKLDSIEQKNNISQVIPTEIPTKDIEPISYSTEGVKISLMKEITPFDLDAESLKSYAEECELKHPDGYFDVLVSQFSDTNKIIYHFRYVGDSQDPTTYTITLLPNKLKYNSLKQFRNDFSMCAAGGDRYPTMLNNKWLLFTKACGTGFDDGSGRPNGCSEIKKIIEPSLKFTENL